MILHDEEMYPEPLRFNPDRYFEDDGQWDVKVRDPASVVFGFGRRICPGQFMAKESLWTTIALMLSTFTFEKVRDGDGREHDSEEICVPGIIG